MELRGEAAELHEYSASKFGRLALFLGALAEKTDRQDQVAKEVEARIALLRQERRRLFNDLLAIKGNLRVWARVRPQFEHEGPSVASFPDDYTVRISQPAGGAAARKDFEFDRVYGPHVSQVELFADVQPVVQSVMDGYNACILTYGPTSSGKSHTMEGPSHDRGLFYRAFDEMFDLANTTAGLPLCHYAFQVTALEIYNEQVRDLLVRHHQDKGMAPRHEILQADGSVVVLGLRHDVVTTPAEFARVLKAAHQNRAAGAGAAAAADRANRSHFIVTIEVTCEDGGAHIEAVGSKLVLADLAGSERLPKSLTSGDRLTESLHLNKAFSALGDVLLAVAAKKNHVPHRNSKLTHLLSDCIGGDAKTLLVVTCSPTVTDTAESIASLGFATRSRNAELSLGSKDTVKKWRDAASEARRDLFEKEKELSELQQEMLRHKEAAKDLDAQALVLFNELQRAWAFSSELKAETDRHQARATSLQAELAAASEKAQRAEEGHEAALLLLRSQLEEEHRSKMVEYVMETEAAGATMASNEVRVQHLERQLAEALAAASTIAARPLLEDAPADVDANQAASAEEVGKLRVTIAHLEEELAKRDELIERLNEENERLVARPALPAQAQEAGTLLQSSAEARPQDASSDQPAMAAASTELLDNIEQQYPKDESKSASSQAAEPVSTTVGETTSVVPMTDREPPAMLETAHGRAGAQANGEANDQPSTSTPSTPRLLRSTAAGEYLTRALSAFSPDQYGSVAAAADQANKMLMLVLAAVVKAERAMRESEMLAELRDAVFSFLGRMEPRRLLDSMLVARTRILYLKALLAKSPELSSNRVHSIEHFLENGFVAPLRSRPSSRWGSRSNSRSNSRSTTPSQSPRHSPKHPLSEGLRPVVPFRVNLSGTGHKAFAKLSSFSWKAVAGAAVTANGTEARSGAETPKGTEQGGRQVATERLKEISQEARTFAIGNRDLAAVFAHGEQEELRRRIRKWLAETFHFLSLNHTAEEVPGDLELLTTSIMHGWLAGLGAAPPVATATDVLGQLLSDYTKQSYMQHIQHLKDVASTLATEDAEDMAAAQRVRTALESVEHKKRKVLQLMKQDVTILANDQTALPLKSLHTAAEDARVASLLKLEEIFHKVEAMKREAAEQPGLQDSHRAQLLALLSEVIPSLLPLDRPTGEQCILETQHVIDVRPHLESTPSKARNMASSGSASDVGSGAGIGVGSTAEEDVGVNNGDGGAARPSAKDQQPLLYASKWTSTGASYAALTEGDGVSRELFPVGGRQGVAGFPAVLQGEKIAWTVITLTTKGAARPQGQVKAGATSRLDLVVKARVERRSSLGSTEQVLVAVLPPPAELEGLPREELRRRLVVVPEMLRRLAIAPQRDGTLDPTKTVKKYLRLYNTIAARVPALREAWWADLEDYAPGRSSTWSNQSSVQSTPGWSNQSSVSATPRRTSPPRM
eukprot:SM000082S22864  [mRNA]  locus=s82:305772:315537:- [translate_table: standard]